MEIKRRDRTLSNTGEDIRRRYELDKLDKLNIEELSKLKYPLPPELGGTGLSSLSELTDNIRNDILSPLNLGTITTETDLNNALDNIYGNYQSVSTVNISWMDGWRWFGTMTKSSANTAFVTAHCARDGGVVKIKTRTNGVWNDSKQVNSPEQMKVLWSHSTGYFMHADHDITLSEPVSAQNTGIILVWSYYYDGSLRNYNFHYQYVPKYHVSAFEGRGINTGVMSDEVFGAVGQKYVYVYDTHIQGNDNNTQTGTASGITFKNNRWALRAVLGY